MSKLRSQIIDLVRRPDATAVAMLIAAIGVLYAVGGAPLGAYAWPDSPRHALNGAFVMDFVGDMPLGDPTGYAYTYYEKYPALTILFYPPAFSFLLAPFYAVFGVSHATALAVVFLFYAALAAGAYAFARLWLPTWSALGVALALVAAPEVAYWGRQVMLEIPAFAFGIWSAVFFVRYLRNEKIPALYLAAAFLVFAVHIKLSIVFLAAPYAICLLMKRGVALFADKHTWIIAALALLGLSPLVALSVLFGQANVQSVSGIADAEVSRWSLGGWLWYAEKIPSQIGWLATLVAIGGLGALAWRRYRPAPGEAGLQNAVFLGLWFGLGYLFFSAIDLKEARHSLFILPPIILLAGYALTRWIRAPIVATAACLALGGFAFVSTLAVRPVLYVGDYDAAIARVADVAPEDSVVVFSGYWDGAFVYSVRADAKRPDLSVTRADKLLLDIAVRRELGVEQRDYTAAEINDLLDRIGAYYIVAEVDFWTDLDQMAKLQSVLQSDEFIEEGRYGIGSRGRPGHTLVLYRNARDVSQNPEAVVNNLSIINRTLGEDE
ncbi:MAG: glycosyltransferase family 39 protein [Pseudomonadota bacterium]